MAQELSATSFLKSANRDGDFKGVNIPSIELPKGGGALKGIDEQFAVNTVNGTVSICIPLPTSPARALTPQLIVNYNSGAGNGIFGLGWNLELGSIIRNTDKQLPIYHDEEDSDSFTLAGMEELVPQFEKDACGNLISEGLGYRIKKKIERGYEIKSYIPRTEGAFSRIEKIVNLSNGLSCWRVTNSNNMTTYYGLSTSSQLSDPQNPRHIFQWLPELTVDHLGNCIRYIYEKDDNYEVNSSFIWNENRPAASFTNIYISKVLYGNISPYHCSLTNIPEEIVLPEESDFMFSTEFEYAKDRSDAFSSYRSGFEIRTLRLCQRVSLYHNFEELGGKTLVRSTHFNYKQDEFMTLLAEAVSKGYVKKSDGSYAEKSLPAQVFAYEEHTWDTTVHNAPQDAQLPVGLTGWQLVDLYNEGIPGLLYEDGNNWFYKKNHGSAQFAQATKVLEHPSFYGQAISFSDLDADGRKQLVCNQHGLQGYFPMDDEGKWQTFTRFNNVPNIDLSQPNIRMIDLNGDGKPDLLITEDHALTWYASEGKKGYAERQSLPTILEDSCEPAVMFSDSSQSIYLADMSGDGRIDIVRIRQGEVCYWPNLGYGRFGKKVTMGNSPVFSSTDNFLPQRILLADIDGTGTTDILYLDTKGVKVWRNGCGNRFSAEPFVIDTFPEIHTMSQITLSDLLGTGTSCLVWSSMLGKDHEMSLKYVDLMSSRKPYLLKKYANNMGKEVWLEYKTSTAYYLEDLLQGNPWNTSLHFPVHCLSKVVTRDLITGWVFANSYHYRDGFFDHDEREFRGFAYVEQKDIEIVEQPATNLQHHELDQEPVLSRSWVHTGTNISGEVDITSSKLLNSYDIQRLTFEEKRQALRCVRGMVLRNEILTEDGKLFQKQTSRSRVELIQPKGQNKYAVFMAVPLESVSYSCEGDIEDARISQSLILETNEYGQVLSSGKIAYPRLKVDNNLPKEAQQSQSETHIVVTFTKTTQDIDTADTYLLRQTCESLTYEIMQLEKKGEFYTLEDFQKLNLAHANLLEHKKNLFYNARFDGPLPLYEQTFPALSYESYAQIYKGDEFKEIFEGRVTEEMLLNSHYVKQDDGTWWVRSGHSNLLDIGEDACSARKRFYLPVSYEDAFGAVTKVEYYKDYFLFIWKTTNAVGLSVEAQEFNFRTLQPEVMVDVNGNKSRSVTDELGMLKAVALLGKGQEADNLDGFTETTTEAEQTLISQLLAAEDSLQISALAKQLLKGASMRYVYDTDNFMRCGKPLVSVAITREEYYAICPDSPVQVAYSYASGFGVSVLEKVQAENQIGSGKPAGSFRWLGNGRTILNNKGNALMTFEPYFSETPAYEDDATVREQGVSPIMHYDAFGRMIRTDFPDGTFQKQEFDAWTVVCYDAGDCVLESDWYKLHQNDRAGKQSEIYAETPSVVYYDSLGQPAVMLDYLKEEKNGTQRMLKTVAKRDIQGNIKEVVDARGNKVVSYKYDMLCRPLYENSLDKGQRWTITDMAGKITHSWDERDHMFEVEYDKLQRPVLGWTHNLSTGKSLITSRIVYGDNLMDLDHSNLEELQKRNVLTMVVQNYDTAGMVETLAYDFRGLPLETERRFSKNYKNTVNWAVDRLETDLEKRTFRTHLKMDALGRITEQTHPDGTHCQNLYNKGALLTAQKIKLKDGGVEQTPICNISYNERREREYVQYGNGVIARFTYDAKTHRINNITSSRNGNLLQDINYTYDSVGRVVVIEDRSIKTRFYDGECVKGQSLYTYDSLGRLISASGRENDAALKFALDDNYSDKAFKALLQKGDVMSLRNYTQRYTYDDANNILQMKHTAKGNSWTRNYTYAQDSNRLICTQVGEQTYKYTYHQKHGFMTSMPHLAEIGWDALERIVYTSKQVRNDGGIPEITYYQYDNEGNRVRKITECQAAGTSVPKLKDERIYQGAYEKYSCFSGANNGLERETISVLDQGHRYVMFEVRNSVDDGTDKELVRYQLDNHQGSTCLELNEKAQVISYEEYHPFGTTAYQAINKNIKAAAKRYRYTGMERDDETGLSYHSARYYTPWLGRWISCDPIGIEGGMNLYCYCKNEPIGHTDTSGYDDEEGFLVRNQTRILGGLVAISGFAQSFVCAGLFVKSKVTAGKFYFGACVANGADNMAAGLAQVVLNEPVETVIHRSIRISSSSIYENFWGIEETEAKELGRNAATNSELVLLATFTVPSIISAINGRLAAHASASALKSASEAERTFLNASANETQLTMQITDKSRQLQNATVQYNQMIREAKGVTQRMAEAAIRADPANEAAYLRQAHNFDYNQVTIIREYSEKVRTLSSELGNLKIKLQDASRMANEARLAEESAAAVVVETNAKLAATQTLTGPARVLGSLQSSSLGATVSVANSGVLSGEETHNSPVTPQTGPSYNYNNPQIKVYDKYDFLDPSINKCELFHY